MSELTVGHKGFSNEGCAFNVLEVNGFDDVIIEFNDMYRHKARATKQNVEKGQVKNPYHPSLCGTGFFGVGRYVASEQKVHTLEYKAWREMIRRCYDDGVHEKRNSYIDCTVYPDWHNFQVFAEWYTSNDFYGLGYHLDKDILFPDNKVYSPETCCLIPAEINTLLNERLAARGEYPTGVSKYKRTGRYMAGIRMNGVRHHLGYFDCPNEASLVYKEKKREYIKEKASEWIGLIDDRVVSALMLRAE